MESFLSSFASSSSSLFSSLVDSTIQPSPDKTPTSIENLETINLQPRPSTPPPQPSFPSTPTQSPILSTTPLLSSTPNPNPLTQELVDRMLELRRVDDVVVADEGRPAFLSMQREMDDLKSELLAAQLQLQEKETVIRELRDQLLAQSLQQNAPPPNDSHPAPTNNSCPPNNDSRPPTIPVSNDGYRPAISKKKKQKMRKRERMEAAANTTCPPGCDSVQLPPLPLSAPPLQQRQPAQKPTIPTLHQQQQQQQQTTLPNVFIYHDSNLKGTTAAEITALINIINNNNS